MILTEGLYKTHWSKYGYAPHPIPTIPLGHLIVLKMASVAPSPPTRGCITDVCYSITTDINPVPAIFCSFIVAVIPARSAL